MTSTESSSRPPEQASAAEDLFFTRLDAVGGDPAALDVDALCAEHPELAPQLREVEAFFRKGLSAVATRPSSQEDAATPALVGDRYEIRRKIDSGGMGSVFEVWDRRLRRILAAKLVRGGRGTASAAEWARRQSRLQNEAQVLGQLVHPGIVPVHEVGETDTGDLFFTMQLVRGRDLGDILREASWSTTRLVGVLLRVCEAVAYAHSKGVVHRDLKPGNVMVGPFGETYVLDWGLAKVTGDTDEPVRTDRGDVEGPHATLEGDVLGTPSYMSPEQAHGSLDEVDARSDVYAAGAILYHAVGGVPPYDDSKGSTPLDLVRAVQEGRPQPLSRLARGAPAELIAIAERAMARNPKRRYASMGELADDLRAYLENRVVRAYRTGATVELRKWIQRNKGAAAAILAVIVGLAGIVFLQTRANESLRERDYVNKVALAAHAHERNDIRRMQQLLAACDSDLRGWEWHHLHRVSEVSEVVMQGHVGPVESVAVSPDGRFLATGGKDGTLRLWNASDGDGVHTWDLKQTVTSISFRGPNRVWVGTGGGEIAVFDVATREQVRTAPLHPGLEIHGSLSPDGALLLVAGRHGLVELYDAETCEPVAELEKGLHGVSHLAWSADGRFAFVAARDREDDDDRASAVRVYDVPGRRRHFELLGHRDWIASVAVHGNRLASGGWDGTVRIWDLETGKERKVLPQRWPQIVRVAWSADGRLLFTGGTAAVDVWDAETLTPREKLVGHKGHVVQLEAHGDVLFTTSIDGDVRRWSLDRDEREIATQIQPHSIAWRPGSDLFALGVWAGHVEIWDATRRARVRTTSIPSTRSLVHYTRTEII